MLARLTSRNRLTLPKRVVESVDAAEYFEVTVEKGRIVLTPVQVRNVLAIRENLEQLGITEQDIEAAVALARR
jgi:hypothetical protein